MDVDSLCATMPQPQSAADEPAMNFMLPDYDPALSSTHQHSVNCLLHDDDDLCAKMP